MKDTPLPDDTPTEMERSLYDALWLIVDQLGAEPASQAWFPDVVREQAAKAVRGYEERYGRTEPSA